MVLKPFRGSFSELSYLNPSDEAILAKPLALEDVKSLVAALGAELPLSVIEDKLDELHAKGYVFVEVLLSKRTMGRPGSWLEVIEKAIFAVKGDEKLFVFRVIESFQYGEEFKASSLCLNFEPPF